MRARGRQLEICLYRMICSESNPRAHPQPRCTHAPRRPRLQPRSWGAFQPVSPAIFCSCTPAPSRLWQLREGGARGSVQQTDRQGEPRREASPRGEGAGAPRLRVTACMPMRRFPCSGGGDGDDGDDGDDGGAAGGRGAARTLYS